MSGNVFSIALAPVLHPLDLLSIKKAYKPIEFAADVLLLLGICPPNFEVVAKTMKEGAKAFEAGERTISPPGLAKHKLSDQTKNVHSFLDRSTPNAQSRVAVDRLREADDFVEKYNETRRALYSNYAPVQSLVQTVTAVAGKVEAITKVLLFTNSTGLTPTKAIALGTTAVEKVTTVAIAIFGQKGALIGTITIKSLNNFTSVIVLLDLMYISYNLFTLEKDQLKLVEMVPYALKITMIAAAVGVVTISGPTLLVIATVTAYLDLATEYEKAKARNTVSSRLAGNLAQATADYKASLNVRSSAPAPATGRVNELQAQIDALVNTRDSLRAQLESAQREAASANRAEERRREDLDKARKELKDAREALEKMEPLKGQLSVATAKIQELEAQLATANEAYIERLEETTKLKEKCADLEEQLKQATEQTVIEADLSPASAGSPNGYGSQEENDNK